MLTFILFAAGFGLLFLSAWFASWQTQRVAVTMRDVTNFAGDVEAWLRSASE